MANHKSALKRHRQSLIARARNRAMKTRVKNAIKAVREAVESKDTAAAQDALRAATAVLDGAASKQIIHWKTAARKVSRLNLAVNKLAV
ncbi:30S ribosomal protein S20 [Fundidesulfovibrio magnetotacticus]|uniref:Small ribosomal subunit protein bS20 n=1 Tax=Fundidesulfovibrio magnetotacticus TaxID=2730080 RepID=A0A6V8LYA5_9BACT|nr:30S ribosomal protein S20 [Fundidesulfovibrio magnetotacticus]GFK95800.1 30S ribosomal protein S20 [Fundidesulfovibrio magnetotacticus]